MGYYWLRLIGGFIIWSFSGFQKKYSDFLKPNIFATLIGVLTIFLFAYLVFGLIN